MLSSSETTLLRNTAFFSKLDDAAFDGIVRDARALDLRKGDVLFSRHDEADRFFVGLMGWVALLRYSPAGDRTVISVFGPGESFAEAAMFMGGSYPASAEAVETSRVCVLYRDRLLPRMAENPDIGFSMLASISMHLHGFMLELEQMKSRNTEQRVARFLLSLCQRQHGPCAIELPYDKSLLAGRLGMKPESLSRSLSRLSAAGVRVSGQTVSVTDPDRLAAVAEQEPMRRHGPTAHS